MARIRLEELKLGMVAEGDVLDRNGQRLVPGGTALTEKHLRGLRIWGIKGVDIRDEGPKGPSAPDPSRMEWGEAQVRKRFLHAELGHPFVRELLRLCVLHFVRRSSEGEGRGQ